MEEKKHIIYSNNSPILQMKDVDMAKHTIVEENWKACGEFPFFMQMKQEKISGVLGFSRKTESADCIRGIARS